MQFYFAQESYMDNRIIPADSVYDLQPRRRDKKTGEPVYDIPGPHMRPNDDEAKKYCERLSHVYTGEIPDVLDKLTDALELTMSKAGAAVDHEKLASGISDGVAKAMAAIMPGMAAAMAAALAAGKPAEPKGKPAEKASSDAPKI